SDARVVWSPVLADVDHVQRRPRFAARSAPAVRAWRDQDEAATALRQDPASIGDRRAGRPGRRLVVEEALRPHERPALARLGPYMAGSRRDLRIRLAAGLHALPAGRKPSV